MSAKDALDRYSARLLGQGKRQRSRQKKNRKPEKDLEAQVLAWARVRGLSLHVVESKAVFSKAAGRYLRGQTEAGMPDLIGNFGCLSVWIELKAQGRRDTLKAHQREFLAQKAMAGCFSCCTDSVDHVSNLFEAFFSATPSHRSDLLIKDLPKIKADPELCWD